jgi:S1-C subfamily serine protease
MPLRSFNCLKLRLVLGSYLIVYGRVCRRDVFTLDVMAVPQGSGSGFIWDKQGHVVTNYHVIRGASDLRYGELQIE